MKPYLLNKIWRCIYNWYILLYSNEGEKAEDNTTTIIVYFDE